jgi:hypothetical protein
MIIHIKKNKNKNKKQKRKILGRSTVIIAVAPEYDTEVTFQE